MPSPVPMDRLDALLLARDARAALRSLAGLQAVELAAEAASPAPGDAAPLAACERVLELSTRLRRDLPGLAAPSSRSWSSSRSTSSSSSSSSPPPALDLAEARRALERLSARADGALTRRDAASAQASRLRGEREALAPFAALPLPSDCAASLQFLRCEVGSVPEERLATLLRSLGGLVVTLPLEANERRRPLVVLSAAVAADALDAALQAARFERSALPGRPGATLRDLAREKGDALAQAEESLVQAARELRALAGEAAGTVVAAERAALGERSLLEAERRLGRTESAVVLSGYVPAPRSGAVAAALAAATCGRCAFQSSPAAEDEAPVLLSPPGPFSAFSGLVTTYGVPRYREVDPTALASLSFLFMFGMMFGDVGHGAVLAGGGLLLSVKAGAAALRDAGKVVLAAGASSMAFGALYGSCFGIEALKRFALWRDPLEGDPVSLLLAAAGVGVAVLSLGVGLGIVNRLRAGDVLGALLDRFGVAGLVFYWSALALVSGLAPARLALPAAVGAALCWGARGPLRHLLSKDPGEPGGLGAVLAESAVGTFEGVLLYLSNTVSFVRLAAYAMSHAALLASAWMLAEAADRSFGHGSALGLAAVVLGNAVALGLEGVVAAVQALRLEYYEFFGKFFEGGGRPFRPFSLPATGGVP